MSNNLSLTPSGPDATGADNQPSRKPFQRRKPAPAAPQPEEPPLLDSGQRLFIQEVGDSGQFVYTVIDRASGQVVARTPREDVARMSQNAGYAAGSLIKVRA
jgi:flagellar protein FlaG